MTKLFKLSVLLLVLSLLPGYLAGQGDPGNTAVIVTAKGYDMKLKIRELKLKTKIKQNEEICLSNLRAGTYGFKFKSFPMGTLKQKITVPENDTFYIEMNYWQGNLNMYSFKEIKKQQAEMKKLRQSVDSLNNLKARIADSIYNLEMDKYRAEHPGIPAGETEELDDVYYIVEEMPTFNGGDPAIEFRRYIANNLRYPESAAMKRIQGRVIVQFAVNKEGRVVNVTVLAGVHPALDAEAIRVVCLSPPWEPGYQRGEPVPVLFTFPINFVIQ